LDDAITSCLSERAAADIEQWRKYARENEGRADLAAARIEELEAERDAALLARYEDRVRRFPMESRYQAELGALYLAAARFDEALRCYQSARRNPAFNLSAGVGAGRSLAGKGLHDLAEREFLDCLALTSARSRERLAVLYELAALYQVLGREEESFGQLKDIYAIDASYRDVGSRLDEYVRIRDASEVPGAANDSEDAI
jgi:tetratricopeptide (TPR) repeat protein